MQFGMPTLIEIKELEICAALCNELGLDFVELNMNLPEYQTDKLDITRLGTIADEYNIYFTIHLDENLSPCDFNDKVAAAYTETVLQTIETAKKLSIPILNMHLHSGVWFTLPDRKVFLFNEYESEYMRKLTIFRDACTKAIGNADIKICVENTSAFQQTFAEKSISALLDSSAFALTFDIGHDAVSGFQQQPLIYQRIERLRHMHIHDAKTNEKQDHLTLGEGKLDLAKYFDLVKAYDCRAVLEVKTINGLQGSIEWLKERAYL